MIGQKVRWWWSHRLLNSQWSPVFIFRDWHGVLGIPITTESATGQGQLRPHARQEVAWEFEPWERALRKPCILRYVSTMMPKIEGSCSPHHTEQESSQNCRRAELSFKYKKSWQSELQNQSMGKAPPPGMSFVPSGEGGPITSLTGISP